MELISRFEVAYSKLPVNVAKLDPLGYPRPKFKTDQEVLGEALSYTLDPVPENLEWAFQNDEIVRAVTVLTTSAVIENLRVNVEAEDPEVKKRVLDVIEKYNRVLNITEFLESVVTNLYIYGNALYYLERGDGGLPYPRLVYWGNVRVEQHPTEKWVRYIYEVETIPEDKIPKTKEEWLKSPPLDFVLPEKKVYTFSEDEVLHFKILSGGKPVGSSPIAPALTYIVYKRLLLYYMTGAVQIYSSPIYVVTVGTLDTLPEEGDVEGWKNYQERIAVWQEILSQIRYHNNIIKRPDTDIKIIQPSGNFLQDYKMAIDIIDKKIFLALVSSSYLVEARGRELATSRTIYQVWREWIDYLRAKIEDLLEDKLYPKVIEALGYDPDEVRVDIMWTEERTFTVDDFVKMVRNLGLPEEEALRLLGFDISEDEIMPTSPEKHLASAETVPEK